MKLNICGSIFEQSGYAVHTKYLAECLQDIGYDVGIEASKPEGWEFGLPDKLFKMLGKDHTRETSIMVATPPFYNFKWADNPKKLIGFCVWEGDRIPTYWLEHMKICNQIWVPSVHVYESIRETCDMEGLPPVHIIPHGVDYKLFYPKKVERDERFTFISVKGWAEGIHDRGGLQYLFKAFVEEFKEDEQVKLLVKVNLFYGGSEAHVEAWLKEMGIEKLPSNVEIVYDNLKFNELVDFYNKGDVFVSPTRGEAFGLNYVEAMACGKPVIATNFGGQTDFIDETVGWLIEYKLEEVIHNPAYEGIKWATPDIKHLKETLRYCFEHQKEIKIKGENALKKIVGEYTWKHTAEKAKKALELFGIKD